MFFFADVDSCHLPSWGISSFGGYTWSGEERWFSLCQSRSLWDSEKGSRGDSETTREWGQLPDLIFSFWRISLHICWMLTHGVVLKAVCDSCDFCIDVRDRLVWMTWAPRIGVGWVVCIDVTSCGQVFDSQIQEARRRMQQEAALEKTQAERREARRLGGWWAPSCLPHLGCILCCCV